MKRILACLLLFAMLFTLLACSKKDKDDNDVDSDTVLVDDEDYKYPDLDCEGAEFTFLNVTEDTWGTNTALVPEGPSAEEIIIDTVYKRNKALEDKFNVKFTMINKELDETGSYLRMLVQSQDDTIDAGLLYGKEVAASMQSNALTDLSTISTLNLYSEWWNQKFRDSAQFGSSGSLYFAQSDISLMSFDLTWCVIANKGMIENKNMDNPYELVRNGQWTLDKFYQMCLEGREENGENFDRYQEGGKSVYGVVTYGNFVLAALLGSEIQLVEKDDLNLPVFELDTSEKFVDFSNKYKTIFTSAGVGLHSNGDGAVNYEEIFEDGRALFVGAEIKAATRYRKLSWDYMILPAPKYSEDQQSYHSATLHATPVMVIPVTNSDTETAGIILDAMAYLSRKDLLPVYYDNTLCLRAVRDLDAVDMLDIIRDTREYETSLLYGWTEDFYYEYQTALEEPTKSVTHTLASHKSSIKSAINEFKESIQ